MAKYLIHARPNRMWYVNEHLIPSMLAQGILGQDIDVECDDNHIGNLESYMKSFQLMDSDGGTWHLTDDIIICRKFKEITELHDDGIVCGFSVYPTDKVGLVNYSDMWWSFPCIRIPNSLANECGNWFYSYATKQYEYKKRIELRIDDDWFFKEFLRLNHPDINVLNLQPSIVDHVDYLIGGSLVRGCVVQIRAKYFDDQDLVKALEKKLNN